MMTARARPNAGVLNLPPQVDDDNLIIIFSINSIVSPEG
jgi:hypothetical protein